MQRVGDAGLVLPLRRDGSERGADVGPVFRLMRRPAVERAAKGGAVAAGEVRQSVVGQHMRLPITTHEVATVEQARHLVGATGSDLAFAAGC